MSEDTFDFTSPIPFEAPEAPAETPTQATTGAGGTQVQGEAKPNPLITGEIGKEEEVKADKPVAKEVKDNSGKPDLTGINNLLKEANLSYKANGKTYKVDNIESLLRMAQRSKPIEDSLSEINRQREELAPVARLIQQLRGEDDELSEQALGQLLDNKRFGKIAENFLRKQYEEEMKYGQMSPREIEMKKALEAQERKLQEIENAKQQEREAAQQKYREQQVNQMREYAAKNVMDALDIMGLPNKLEPLAVHFMQPIMKQMLANKIPLDPEILAEKVGPIFDELLSYKVKNLEGEKLLKFLGDDTGKKVRQAFLAQLNTKPVPQAKPVDKKAVEEKKLDSAKDMFKNYWKYEK